MPTPALYINEFSSGLYTQRSPLVTPTTSQGLSTIVRTDVLAGGLNAEMSNNSTWARRPGWTRFCPTLTDRPLNYHAFRDLTGTIRLMKDSLTTVSVFSQSADTAIWTKGSTQQSEFQTVGNVLYWCNGTDAKKWDGTTVSDIGIVAPVLAPTIGFTAGGLSPKTGFTYGYCYRGANQVSTMSPTSASTLAQTNKNITLTGQSSASSYVTSVEIYATLDGGSNYYFLASVANTPGVNWSYTDSVHGVNNFILAPRNHANDPIPAGAQLICYHMGRLWIATGNKVYFAGGPDVTNGSPEESWPTANVFVYPGTVTAFAPTTQGLLLFTHGDSYIIRGQDSSSFYSQPWQANFGVASQNCVVQDGDLLFLYTSRRQLFCISATLDEVGFAIGDQLAASFDPVNCYLALHRSGTDAGLFLSDGSGNVFPYRVTKDAWSPKAAVVGGIGCIKSIAVTDSDYRLMGGRAGDGYVLFRDLTKWQDDGTNYSWSIDLGQLVVAPLGALAHIEAVSVERMPVGSAAVVSVMLQEISGTFTALPNPVNDPPLLPASTTIITQRHYIKAAQAPLPQQVRHLQVRVAFPAENAHNELLGLALLKAG